MTSRRHEFTAAETADLLDELDVRLRRRRVAASIFVVGRCGDRGQPDAP
jgi:hypothetical protein